MIDLDRATQIGHQIADINSAIAEGKIAYSNAHLGGSRYGFYDTDLFGRLAARREALRAELIGSSSPASTPVGGGDRG